VTQPPSYPPPQPPPGGYSIPPQGYYQPPAFRPLPAAPNGAPLADFGQRFAAYLLDGLVMAAVMIVPVLVALALFIPAVIDAVRNTPVGGQPNLGHIYLLYFLLLAVLFSLQLVAQYLYQVIYQVRKGQTVGKRVMKIKIVSLLDGSPMGTIVANKRFLVQVGCSLLGPLAYLDGLWQLWDQPYRQCLHDKWAQTVVVRVSA
jgi:uncharacterized RDD family membrane protein YckC